MALSARLGVLRLPSLGRGWRLLVLGALAFVLALSGGASRFDEDQQAVVRLAAILVLGVSLWPLDFKPLIQRPGLLLAAAAAYLLLLIQLIPLPPGVWAALPGHGPYASIASAAGAVVWRPLSLTPDLTLNALYALLPATAAGVGALYLEGRQRIWLARAAVIIACASAVLGVMQVGAGEAGPHLYRITSEDAPVGLLANRNHQAAFLSCALPLIGALAGVRRRDEGDPRIALSLALGAAGMLVLAVISTGSRMGLLLCLVGCLAGLWAYKAAGRRLLPKRPVLRLAFAAGALVLLAGVGLAAARGGAVERLAHTNRVSETRAAMVEPLLTTAKAFAPLGSGFGSFDSVFRRFEPRTLLSTIYMNEAHNEPLQLAIEGGAPALLLLVAFAVWWTLTATRVLGRGRSTSGRALAIAWTATTVILMTSSLVDYPLRTPLLSVLFVLACVEMARTSRRLGEMRPTSASPQGAV
jgi:O-antigen ligase